MLAPEKMSLTYSWHCEKNRVLHEVKIIKLILTLCTCYFPQMCQNTLKSAFAQHNEKLTTLERFLPPLFLSRLCWSLKWKSLWPDLRKAFSWWKVQRGGERGRELQRRKRTSILSESDGICEGGLSSFSPHLEEIYLKAVVSRSGFCFLVGWGRGGGLLVILTFSSFGRRMYDSWETKDLIVSMFEFSKHTWNGPIQGWWAQRTWMIPCNVDLCHVRVAEPTFWNWLPCLFYKLFLISIL